MTRTASALLSLDGLISARNHDAVELEAGNEQPSGTRSCSRPLGLAPARSVVYENDRAGVCACGSRVPM
jgi:hypothetical protein